MELCSCREECREELTIATMQLQLEYISNKSIHQLLTRLPTKNLSLNSSDAHASSTRTLSQRFETSCVVD